MAGARSRSIAVPDARLARDAAANRGPRRRHLNIRRRRVLLGVVGLLAILIPWQLLEMAGIVSGALSSSPILVVQAIAQLVPHAEIWTDIWVTVQEWLISFALAAVSGVILGLVAGWYRRVRLIVNPGLNVLYAAPSLALLPLYIAWFGIGMEFAIAFAYTSALFVVTVSTMGGVTATQRQYLAVATSFGASRARTFRTVIFPSSVPFIVSGLRQGVAYALLGTIAAEFVASNSGLGYFINVSGQTIETSQVMAGLVLLGLMAAVVIELFRRLGARFESWRSPVRSS